MSNFDPSISKEMPHNFSMEVSRLFELGIQDTPYAWHGTSVDAILYLAEHGELPASGSSGSEFFFAPEYLAPGEQEEHGKHYAWWNASKVYITQKLPFEVKDKERFMYMFEDDELLESFIKEEASPHGITEEQLVGLFKETTAQCEGVLLGISSSITQDFKEGAFAGKDQKSVIIPQGGLPIKYITGIEALGQYEWDQLITVQESLKPKDSPD
jgi:hypothetical protein